VQHRVVRRIKYSRGVESGDNLNITAPSSHVSLGISFAEESHLISDNNTANSLVRHLVSALVNAESTGDLPTAQI